MKNRLLKMLPILASCRPRFMRKQEGSERCHDTDSGTCRTQTLDNNAQKGMSVEQTAFLQSVNDNHVYAKDIAADASFKIEMGDEADSMRRTTAYAPRQNHTLADTLPIIRTEIARVDFTPRPCAPFCR